MTLSAININDLRFRDIQSSSQTSQSEGIASFANILGKQINYHSGIDANADEMSYNLDVEALMSELDQDGELMTQLQSLLDSLGIDLNVDDSQLLFARLTQIIEQYFENSKMSNADDYKAIMSYLADILASLSEISAKAAEPETPLVESVSAVNSTHSSDNGGSEIDGYNVNSSESGANGDFSEVIKNDINTTSQINEAQITATEIEEARVLNILDEGKKYLNNHTEEETIPLNNNSAVPPTPEEPTTADSIYVKRFFVLEKLFQSPGDIIINVDDVPTDEIEKAALDMFDKMMLIAQEKLGAAKVSIVQESEGLVPENFALFKNFTKIANNFSNKPDEMNSLLASLKGENQESQNLINPQDITGNVKYLQLKETFESAKVPVTTQISQQITAKMSNLANGEIKFEMQINPEELGELKIKIVSNGSKVELEIIAERPETALLLRERADEMALALKRNGVEIEKYEILREPGQNSESNKDSKNQEREQQNREEKVIKFDENFNEEEMEFLEFLQVV